MYNRIGLQTPRGSGTSGYVTANLSAPKPIRSKLDFLKEMRRLKENTLEVKSQADPAILQHKKKREIYAFLEEMREELIQSGKEEKEVEDALALAETRMLDKFAKGELEIDLDVSNTSDTHILIEIKRTAREKLQRALGISSDYKSGSAFDFENQEKEKLERRYLKELKEVEELQKEALKQLEAENKDVKNVNEKVDKIPVVAIETLEVETSPKKMEDIEMQESHLKKEKEAEKPKHFENKKEESDYSNSPIRNHKNPKESNFRNKDEHDRGDQNFKETRKYSNEKELLGKREIIDKPDLKNQNERYFESQKSNKFEDRSFPRDHEDESSPDQNRNRKNNESKIKPSRFKKLESSSSNSESSLEEIKFGSQKNNKEQSDRYHKSDREYDNKRDNQRRYDSKNRRD